MSNNSFEIIAHIHTDFPEKFGIPRQSGIIDELEGIIVFTPRYRNKDALRGIEGFSHIWLLWQFSKTLRDGWQPTVRPPRLGGNKKMGVFATRSPFRPNPIGLSCVRLGGVEEHEKYGTVLKVYGADIVDGTPIYDIKPYLPFADAHPEAKGGFAEGLLEYKLEVIFPEDLLANLPESARTAAKKILENDPRPSYINEPERVYGFSFVGFNIEFKVKDNCLTVINVKKI